jgi:3'-phosphoadenosine 5'-phosphosulfate sulfotransferase (PAPS reductase)/FAD synthetase
MASPYTLPPGNVQIAFSGGRTSAYMLHHILEANGGLPDRVEVTFQNTGREMPETLDFVSEVGSRWGVPTVWLEYRPRTPIQDWQFDAVVAALGPEYAGRFREWWVADGRGFAEVSHNSAAREGEPFLALILSKKYLPNQMTRFCTIELKIRTAKRYLVSLGWKRWTNATGIRADEPARLAPKIIKDRWTNWHPLAPAGVSRHDVAAFWRGQPFDLRLPNVGGNCWLGNCDGCFLKAEAHVAALARDFPERAAWWERVEALVSALASSKGRPKDNAQFSKRYSRRELREFMDRQGDNFDRLTQTGILCQANDGECTA